MNPGRTFFPFINVYLHPLGLVYGFIGYSQARTLSLTIIHSHWTYYLYQNFSSMKTPAS